MSIFKNAFFKRTVAAVLVTAMTSNIVISVYAQDIPVSSESETDVTVESQSEFEYLLDENTAEQTEEFTEEFIEETTESQEQEFTEDMLEETTESYISEESLVAYAEDSDTEEATYVIPDNYVSGSDDIIPIIDGELFSDDLVWDTNTAYSQGEEINGLCFGEDFLCTSSNGYDYTYGDETYYYYADMELRAQYDPKGYDGYSPWNYWTGACEGIPYSGGYVSFTSVINGVFTLAAGTNAGKEVYVVDDEGTVLCYVNNIDGASRRHDILRFNVSAGKTYYMYADNSKIRLYYLGFSYGSNSQSIKLNVTDSDGNEITDGYTVTWYSNDNILGTGSSINITSDVTSLDYMVTLDETTSLQYYQPQLQTVNLEELEGSSVNLVLSPIPKTTLSGKAVYIENQSAQASLIALSNADVVIVQNINNIDISYETTTDENGKFSVEVLSAYADVTISCDGFYTLSKTAYIVNSSEYSMSDIILTQLPDTKIILSMSIKPSVIDGEAYTTSAVTDFSDFDFVLYNKTQAKTITEFTAQYPSIIIEDNSVAAGDTINIKVTDADDALSAEEIDVVIGEDLTASASIQFSQNGKIRISSFSGATDSRVLIFNGSGSFVKGYNVGTSAFRSDILPDGSYSVVVIKSTDLLKNVSSLSKFASLGLEAGTDYVLLNAVTSKGKVTDLGSVTVPDFDESKLYYTVSTNTGFYSNKTSVTAGQYLTLKAYYEIDGSYTTSNQKVVVEIPQGLTLVANSVALNGNTVSYSYSDNELTVYTNNAAGEIYFYATGTESGSFSMDAYIGFVNDGSEVLQPIGSSVITVKDMTLSVPDTVSVTEFTISGTALPDEVLSIYLDDAYLGAAQSNSVGYWKYTVVLENSYNLDYHTLYYTVDVGGNTISSETASFWYDSVAADVKTVTMYAGSYEIVFDFMNIPSVSSWYSWSESMTGYSFEIDFSGNAEDVILYVTTVDGSTKSFDATYDETKDIWIVYAPLTGYNNAPVNVAVGYSETAGEDDYVVSSKEFAEVMNYQLNFDDIETVSDEISAKTSDIFQQVETYIDTDIETAEDLEQFLALFDEANEQYSQLLQEIENSSLYDSELLSDYSSDIEVYDSDIDLEAINAMSDEEYIAYVQQLCNEITACYAQLDSLYEDIQEIAEADTDGYTTSTCDGITEDELIADGYEAVKTDEGGTIYYKSDGSVMSIVDFANNTMYSYTLDEETIAAFAEAEAFAEGVYELTAYDGFDWSSFMNDLLEIQSKADWYLSVVKNAIDGVIYAAAQSVTKAAALVGDYKVILNQAQSKSTSLSLVLNAKNSDKTLDLIRKGGMDLLSIKAPAQLGLYGDQYTKALTRLAKCQSTLNYIEKITGKFFNNFMGIVNILNSIVNSVKTFSGLYNSLPSTTCKNDTTEPQATKDAIAVLVVSEIAYLGVTVGFLAAQSATGASIALIPLSIGLFAAQTAADAIHERVLNNQLNTMRNRISNLNKNCKTEDDDKDKEKEDDDNDDDSKDDSGDDSSGDSSSSGDGTGGDGDNTDDGTGDGTSDGTDGGTTDAGKKYKPYQGQNVPALADPSGYVYEAVPSNRLEGVTATCYYSDGDIDETGELTGNYSQPVIWNAQAYGQENPLITNSDGEYAWDVTMGSWRVKYEKSGYTTAYSDWLPVPPPQLGINCGLVSTQAPEVESVNVYDSEIEIIFSKYVKMTAADAISVMIEGSPVSGTVQGANTEMNAEETEEFASVFKFVPDEVLSGTITVNIAPVEGYNSLLSQEYTSTQDVTVKPQYITVPGNVSVDYNGNTTIEVEILPGEAAEGLVVEASTLLGSIAAFNNTSATLDSNGKATFTVNGNLIGQTVATFTVPGTTLSAQSVINVALNNSSAQTCEKVTSNYTNGSVLSYGTEIILSTPTEGAEIYYTLDGTCPCVVDSQSRILYTEPIVITQDMFIIAYAVKDGFEDSSTAGFVYTAAEGILGDADCNGIVTAADAAYTLQYVLNSDFHASDEIWLNQIDVDGNGQITASDAAAILQKVLNNDFVFPAETE